MPEIMEPYLGSPARLRVGSKLRVSEQLPVNFRIDNTECSGELIDVTGTLHIVNHFTVQEDGTHHVNSQFNFAGVKGVGLNPRSLKHTGTEYIIPAAGDQNAFARVYD